MIQEFILIEMNSLQNDEENVFYLLDEECNKLETFYSLPEASNFCYGDSAIVRIYLKGCPSVVWKFGEDIE